MGRMSSLARQQVRLFLVLALLAVVGCGTPPRYDAETDKAISALQSDIDKHLGGWKRAAQQFAAAVAGGNAAAALSIRRRFAEPAQLDEPFDGFETQLMTIEFRLLAEEGLTSSRVERLIANVRSVLEDVRNQQAAAAARPSFIEAATVQILREQVRENMTALLRVVKNRQPMGAR